MSNCCKIKYSSFVEDNSYYDYTPVEYVEGAVMEISFSDTENVITYNGVSYHDGDTANFVNFGGKTINVKVTNDGPGPGNAGSLLNGDSISLDYQVLSFGPINPGDNYTYTVTFPELTERDATFVMAISTNYSIVSAVSDDRSWHVWNLCDIISDSLVTTDLAEFFNEYYKCWCINPSCNEDFKDTLIAQYHQSRERIALYETAVSTFDGKAKTVMGVQYGQRNTSDDDYNYPISGSTSTSKPSSGHKSVNETVTDTTTVTKDDDPFTRLIRFGLMDTFNKFFVDQFIDCFTLVGGMTW